MTHWAQYIKRIICDPSKQSGEDLPYVEKQPLDQGFESPIYHTVPTGRGVGSRVKVGDTIWLFSQLKSPWGRLPPSLDAKIEVINRSMIENGKRYRFEAGEGSKWFPLFDCTAIIKDMKQQSATPVSDESKSLLLHDKTVLGQALRFMRAIEDPTPLIPHAEPVDFISYRMIDGTQLAFKLAQHLLSKGRWVFWDRWSLPRRLAERREDVSPDALNSTIKRHIEASRVVWGVESPQYAKPNSYSFYEKTLATRYRAYPPWSDDEL